MDNEPKNQYVENIVFCLQGDGYETVSYNDSNAGFFKKKGNPNVTEETMYLPAVIKDVNGAKIVTSAGIVYIPVVEKNNY